MFSEEVLIGTLAGNRAFMNVKPGKNSGYDQTSNPVAILVYSDGTITANFGPSFVVPEYLYGALLSMAACFAAFIIIKRPRINLRIR
jgi:hypothetical protein